MSTYLMLMQVTVFVLMFGLFVYVHINPMFSKYEEQYGNDKIGIYMNLFSHTAGFIFICLMMNEYSSSFDTNPTVRLMYCIAFVCLLIGLFNQMYIVRYRKHFKIRSAKVNSNVAGHWTMLIGLFVMHTSAFLNHTDMFALSYSISVPFYLIFAYIFANWYSLNDLKVNS